MGFDPYFRTKKKLTHIEKINWLIYIKNMYLKGHFQNYLGYGTEKYQI